MAASSGGRARGQAKPVQYLPSALADLTRLGNDHPRLLIRARALIGLVASGEFEGELLQLLPMYGDLADCRKVYFGLTSDNATHRIVYRSGESGHVEVIEVVAVEQRDEGYVYLLAAQRLGRLPDETRRRFDRVHQTVIKRRGSTRTPKAPPAKG